MLSRIGAFSLPMYAFKNLLIYCSGFFMGLRRLAYDLNLYFHNYFNKNFILYLMIIGKLNSRLFAKLYTRYASAMSLLSTNMRVSISKLNLSKCRAC